MNRTTRHRAQHLTVRLSPGQQRTALFFASVACFVAAWYFRSSIYPGFSSPSDSDSIKRFMSLVGLAPFTIGLIPLYYAIFGLPRREPRFPDRPWLERPEWAAGRIRSRSPFGLGKAWALAAFGLAFAVAPAGLLVVRGPELGLWGVLFTVPFFAVSAGMVGWAVYLTRRRMKYGVSLFEMARVPGLVGGGLRGTVETRAWEDSTAPVVVSLECVNIVRSGSSKGSGRTEIRLWRDESHIPPASIAQGFGTQRIPVVFSIPANLPESDTAVPGWGICWKLRVKSSQPGIDFSTEFEVPVFITDQSPANAVAGTELEAAVRRGLAPVNVWSSVTRSSGAPATAEQDRRQPAPAAQGPGGTGSAAGELRSAGSSALPRGVRVGPSAAGGLEFYFGAARNPVQATILSGAGSAMVFLAASAWERSGPGLLTAFFAALGLLVLAGSLEYWLWVRRVEIHHGWIHLRSGPLGISRRRTFSCSAVSDVGFKTTGKNHDLHLKLHTGKKVLVARAILDLGLAKRLASEMGRAIGLHVDQPAPDPQPDLIRTR